MHSQYNVFQGVFTFKSHLINNNVQSLKQHHKPKSHTEIFHKHLVNTIHSEYKVTSGSPWKLAALLKLKRKLNNVHLLSAVF